MLFTIKQQNNCTTSKGHFSCNNQGRQQHIYFQNVMLLHVVGIFHLSLLFSWFCLFELALCYCVVDCQRRLSALVFANGLALFNVAIHMAMVLRYWHGGIGIGNTYSSTLVTTAKYWPEYQVARDGECTLHCN